MVLFHQYNVLTALLQQMNKRKLLHFCQHREKKPPKCWYHSPDLKDNDGNTVAMRFTIVEIDIPREWYHDPTI